MKRARATLQPENIYHVYNRAHGKEQLFIEEMNYHFFLKKFKEYIYPIAEVYSYCLMPNHFHVLIKVKSEEELNIFFQEAWKEKSITSQAFPIDKKVTQQFSNFFNAYTKAFNKTYCRLGGLFISNYRRIKIENDKQFLNTVKYIHFNPVNARLTERPEDWKYSSYEAYITNKRSLVSKEYVIGKYGDFNNFLAMHGTLPRHQGL
jgi:REP element-mobilizing transposase RayT